MGGSRKVAVTVSGPAGNSRMPSKRFPVEKVRLTGDDAGLTSKVLVTGCKETFPARSSTPLTETLTVPVVPISDPVERPTEIVEE